VAIVAAAAGLVYLLLLPVCGIASIAGGVALGAWRWVRAGAQQDGRGC
jgi:hypothetical protein